MFRLRFKRLSGRGDTLVEVLIALAALSAIIGFSYSTSTKAQKVAQLNQDRATATKHVESQLELIRAKRDKEGTTELHTQAIAVSASGDFCITRSGTTYPFKPITDTDCSLGSIFRQKVTYNDVDKLFTATVEWDNYTSGTSGAVDRVQLVYRLR